jgi:hypothetical protein
MGFEETLSRFLTLEALHLSLAPSDGDMRILGAVVVAQSTAMMVVAETEFLKRGAAGAKTIADDPLRLDVLIPQQPSQQSNSSAGVATEEACGGVDRQRSSDRTSPSTRGQSRNSHRCPAARAYLRRRGSWA